MSSNNSKIIDDISAWKAIVKDKWLLFDTCAINIIVDHKAYSIFETLKLLNVKNKYIHPISMELKNTNDPKLAAIRASVLDANDFESTVFDIQTFELADKIQFYLSNQGCRPSPIDLYLGATMAKYKQDSILVLTNNLKDFPKPLYERLGYIVVEGEKQSRLLAIVSLNKSELDKTDKIFKQ